MHITSREINRKAIYTDNLRRVSKMGDMDGMKNTLKRLYKIRKRRRRRNMPF